MKEDGSEHCSEEINIINIYASTEYKYLMDSLKESLEKPSWIPEITETHQYIIFKINRRFLKRKNLHVIDFEEGITINNVLYKLTFMIIHHGNGESGGHYYCIAETEDAVWKISDKYAQKIALLDLPAYYGSEECEMNINNGLLNQNAVAQYDTASILVYKIVS